MKIFIGSSKEHYPVAKEIAKEIKSKLTLQLPQLQAEIVIWEAWFERGENNNISAWQAVVNATNYFDCAIMLLAGDDDVKIREKEYKSTRDNVLIETGAFAILKGIENIFLLVEKNDEYHIPTDYMGLNVILFDYERGAENPDAYQRIFDKLKIMATDIGGNGYIDDTKKFKESERVIRGKIR